MQVVLFRHGPAEPHAAGVDDASRALTEEGRDKTARAATGLAGLIDPPGVILTSPLLRAVQTAELLGRVFGLEPVILDALAEGSPRRIAGALEARTEPILVAVGHNPALSELVQLWCTRSTAEAFVSLKKAGAACLEVSLGHSGGNQLRWLASPKMLRALV